MAAGIALLPAATSSFAGKHAGILLGVLPPIVHIRKESDKAALRWSLERMRQELREPQPGGFLVAQHLAYMMLVQALRLHLAEGLKGGVGWLFALADKQMSAAINAMHDDPAHRWTLQELAKRAGMSRSTFALKFKETVGASPIEYLTRWRMLLAGDRLTNSSDPISVIALSLGYESESAFSTAFKRIMGCSPRQYGRSRTPAFPQRGGSRPRRSARTRRWLMGGGWARENPTRRKRRIANPRICRPSRPSPNTTIRLDLTMASTSPFSASSGIAANTPARSLSAPFDNSSVMQRCHINPSTRRLSPPRKRISVNLVTRSEDGQRPERPTRGRLRHSFSVIQV